MNNMIISSIHLKDVQKHASLNIDGLCGGINLFTAPNGWGKSTIARAVRAAFLETHKTTTVKFLCPNHNPGAAPAIDIDFDFDGKSFSLKKQFMKTPRAVLLVSEAGKPTVSLEGKEAEEYLAGMLGHEMAQQRSKPTDQGIPGLLWIEQGQTNSFIEAIGNAHDKIQSVLGGAMGEVASTAGDKVMEAVTLELDGMITKRGARTGSEYASTLSRLDEVSQQCLELTSKIAEYRQQVDELAEVRALFHSTEKEKPWLEMESRLTVIHDKLGALEVMQKEKASIADTIDNLATRLQLLQEKSNRMESEKRDLLDRKARIEERNAVIQTLNDQQEAMNARVLQAAGALDGAKQQLKLAQDAALIADIEDQIEAIQKQLAAIRGAKDRITGLEADLRNKRMEAAGSTIEEGALIRLRELRRAIDDIRIQQQALATRVTFTPAPGKHWSGSAGPTDQPGTVVVVEKSVFSMDGWGSVTVDPGAEDLGEMVSKERDSESAIRDILGGLGVSSIADAEVKLRTYQTALSEIDSLEKAIEAAGGSSEVLAVEEKAVAERLDNLQSRRNALPENIDVPPGITVDTSKIAVSEMDSEHAELSRLLRETEASLMRAEMEQNHARDEVAASALRVESEGWIAELRSNADSINSTKLDLDEASKRAAELDSAIEAEMPDLLRQDAQRLQSSIDNLLAAQNDRNIKMVRLEAILAEAGQHNSEERLAELTAERERLARRRDQMALRAEALSYLVRLLQDGRAKTLQKIQAPLQKHISRYLRMLFPSSVIEINDRLEPVALKMGQEEGVHALSQLSYGTVEQISLICRLAYADLLRESGKPTVIMLDDALVHTDDTRVGAMKRVIFDAATRHQILMFSCHPKTWDDLGGRHIRLCEV